QGELGTGSLNGSEREVLFPSQKVLVAARPPIRDPAQGLPGSATESDLVVGDIGGPGGADENVPVERDSATSPYGASPISQPALVDRAVVPPHVERRLQDQSPRGRIVCRSQGRLVAGRRCRKWIGRSIIGRLGRRYLGSHRGT